MYFCIKNIMRQLFILGDIHNRWDILKIEIEEYNIRNADIIHVGDGGFGFYPRRLMHEHLTKQNDYFKERGIVLYNVRGNHDNPNWFLPPAKMLAFFRAEDKAQPAWKMEDLHYIYEYIAPITYALLITTYSNLKFVQDYSVLELSGHKILCIGGAISIDRMMLQEGTKYFKNELLVYKPAKLKKLRDIDIVVTHTTPAFIPPLKQESSDLVMQFTKHDTKLLPELKEERVIMSQIYEDISKNNKIDKWFYGHFHAPQNIHHGGVTGTQFLCISPNKSYKLV
jgi:UDP-2,3-diacylglucosamine pyrophosphatase LpxH